MLSCKLYPFFVIISDYFIDLVDAKLLHTLSFWAVANILYEYTVNYYSFDRKFDIDESSKNKNTVIVLNKRYRIKWVVIFAYHFSDNRIIEWDFKPIINTFSKISSVRSIHEVEDLLVVLGTNC